MPTNEALLEENAHLRRVIQAANEEYAYIHKQLDNCEYRLSVTLKECADLRHDLSHEVARRERLLSAVIGEFDIEQRKALLETWANRLEQEQGYESALSHWISGIAEALGELND